MPRGKFDSTNQKHYLYLGNDTSSVWNFSLRASSPIWASGTSPARTRQRAAKLHSFLRRHLAGKPVVASRNVFLNILVSLHKDPDHIQTCDEPIQDQTVIYTRFMLHPRRDQSTISALLDGYHLLDQLIPSLRNRNE